MKNKRKKIVSPQKRFKTKLGLALGGGGARGAAHLGVLRAFADKNIEISCIAGTSVGAFVAALYAFGKSPSQIETVFENLSFLKISSLFPVKLGLSRNQGVHDLLEKELGNARIEEAQIPLAIVCTDLITGHAKVFTRGPLAKIVQASASFPGIYSPIEYHDMILVDGAISENIPVSGVKTLGANFIVGVSLSDYKQHNQKPKGLLDVIGRCFDIIVDQNSIHQMKMSDYMINLDVSFMSRFKLTEKERAITLGYSQTQSLLSRSLWYWWFKPHMDYFYGVIKSLKELFSALFSHPKYKVLFGAVPGEENLWGKIKKWFSK